MEITRRYRVNVGTSVKGIKTYDCTVELTCHDSDGDVLDDMAFQGMILSESDALVKELDKRYPPHIEEKK